MKKIQKKPEGLELANLIASFVAEKKGTDIVAISLDKLTTIADYFVIASASNTTQVRAIAENIDEHLSKNYEIEPLRREGMQEARWVALDYSTVIVHVFLAETRQFYQMERLWTNESNLLRLVDDKLIISAQTKQ